MGDGTEAGQGKAGSLEAFREVLRNPNLRRLQLAWAGSNLGTWGFGVGLTVFAYGHGGAAAVGLVALLRWIPAAVAAPFMGVLGDRHSRRLVMVLSDLGRVVVIGSAAIAVWLDLGPVIVYMLAAAGVVISTAFRPAQAAMIPSLVASPEELTASNVVSSSIESVGMFLGPAIGGLVLAVSGVAAVFLIAVLAFVWSAALISLIRPPEPSPATGPTATEAGSAVEGGEDETSFLRESTKGFGLVFREANPRLLIGVFAAQTTVAGALVVLQVVIALELLGKGDAWVGVTSAVFGIGGIVGAFAAAALVGRNRLAGNFVAGILLWGFPLILIGIWPSPAVALGALAAMGLGNTLVDVSGLTLLQRAVPDELLARVFGVLETVVLLTVALGAAFTPVLIDALGAETSLIAIGCFLPIVIALTWRSLAKIDAASRAPERELALLGRISFFEPLPPPVLEGLARRLQPFRVSTGTRIIDQGEVGDRFYVVAQGQVEIVRDGEVVNVIEPGGYFGEIALLRDVPRQASAVARADSELFALEGDVFVTAVTGHGPSSEAALGVIQSYGVGALGGS
jgi:MFS family permease